MPETPFYPQIRYEKRTNIVLTVRLKKNLLVFYLSRAQCNGRPNDVARGELFLPECSTNNSLLAVPLATVRGAVTGSQGGEARFRLHSGS